jgi:hypothetical protein
MTTYDGMAIQVHAFFTSKMETSYQFHAPSALRPCKELPAAIRHESGWPQGLSGRRGEQKNFLPPLELEYRLISILNQLLQPPTGLQTTQPTF